MNASSLRRMRTAAHTGLLGVSLFALATGAALAQSDAQTTSDSHAPATSPNLGEVVVTASRRVGQNLQNTPIAIDAYSGQTLEKYNIQAIQDIGKLDPSINIQSYGATQQQIIIRGISSSIGRTTGIYVDEAPLQGGFNANNFGDGSPGLRMHDVDHVEVLKGPQGTLFGAGSMDGTLRVITAKPKLSKYEAMVEGTGAGVDGGNGYFDGDAMVNVPIIKDKLGLRAVVWGESGGGYIDQTIAGRTRNNVNDEHIYGGRLELLFKPTDRLSILGEYDYQNTKVDGSQAWTRFVGPLNAAGGTTTGPYHPYQNGSPTQEPYRAQYRLYTLTGQYDTGFGSFVATGTQGQLSQVQLSDTTPSDCSYGLCAGTSAYPAAYSPDEVFADTTAELRFSSKFRGPFQLVAGGYYERDIMRYAGAVLHAKASTGALSCDTYGACLANGLDVPGGSSPVQFANADHFNVDQYALYAQGDYRIVQNLTLTFGARYFAANLHDMQITQQNISPTTTPYGFDGGYVLGDVTTPYVSSRGGSHESKPTYNVSLLWEADPRVSFYVRAASGFRIGGINETATIAAQEGISVPGSYAPDSLWDYEGGVKTHLLNRSLYLDLSIYHIDWSNEQVNALAAGVYNYTLNVGKTSTTGFELSGDYKPKQFPGLTLGGSFTYVDAKLAQNLPASVVQAGTPGMKGDPVPYVPNVSFSGRGEYERPLFADVNGYLQADFTYHGDSNTAFRASTPAEIIAYGNNYDTKLPAYFLLDMRAGVRVNRYDVSIFCDNLTNEVAYLGASARLDAVRIFSARPRTVGVHVTAHF